MAGMKKAMWLVLLVAPMSLEAQGQAVPARQDGLRVQHLSVEDGLPHASVKCILQDRQGFMWFGSHGLCKYDGQRIKVYRPRIPDPGAMLFDIRVMYEDKDGILWVGTEEAGLAQFDPLTETFTVYQYNQYDPNTLSDKAISAIAEDREGILWIGTVWNGINRFDPRTLKITRYPFFSNRKDPSGLYGRSVEGICEGAAGRIWVATGRGVSLLNPATDQFTHYENNGRDAVPSWPNGITSVFWDDAGGHLLIGTGKDGIYELDPSTEASSPFALGNDVNTGRIAPVTAICKERSGPIWIGTEDGLLQLHENRTILGHYRHDPGNVRTLASNEIQCVYQDRSGLMWVGTAKGINWFDPSPQPLTVLSQPRDGEPEKPLNNVSSISQDASGRLWIGTWGDGLQLWDSETDRWQSHQHEAANPNSLAHYSVTDTHISRKNPEVVWIGHSRNAFSRLDLRTGQITRARELFDDRNEISDGRVNCLFEDRANTLWIGTWFGLNWLDQDTHQCGRYQPDATDPELKVPVHISAIGEDASGVLWVGTRRGGLYRLNRESGRFTRYLSDPNDAQSLSHNHIRSIFNDSQGRLWVATRDGLSRYNPGSDSFNRYLCSNFPFGEENWAHQNDIRCVLEDDLGQLWAGSQDGLHVLSALSETSHQERHIKTMSGYRLGACRRYARLRGKDGTLYFGTTNGLFAIHPERMSRTAPPKVVLTDLRLFNQSVPIASQGTPLTAHISTREAITVGPGQHMVTFDFAALDYVDPSQNQYAYRLEGLIDEWVDLDHQASVTFTDLAPGDYVFHVKAANSDGVWNETGTSVALIVTPLWWQTMWFRVLAVALVIGVIVGGLEGRVQLLKAHRRSLEAKVAERTSELQATQDEVSKARDNLQLQVQQRTVELRQEIAEREQADQKYRTVVENAGEAIFVTQDDFVKYCNALALEISGYTEEEVRSKPFFEFIHPGDRGKAEEEYRKRLSGQELLGQYPIRILAKGGQVRWVLVNAALIDWEGRPASLTLLTDITSRIRAEEELRLSQETLKRAQSVAHIGSWQLDMRAKALRWSNETHRIFGIPVGSPLTYERFLEVVHPEDRERVDAAWRASLNGARYDIEHRIIVDGKARWVRERAEIEFDDEGKAVSGVGTVQDISEQKALEAESHRLRSELAHMDRVSTTGALTAAIAHEINQPLAAVLSNAQAALRFLSQEHPDLDEVRDTLRDIVGDDKRAAEVIRRLRALLKKESTSAEPVDANAVATEVISLVHSEAVMRNVTLISDLAEDAPRVLGDRIQIQQVILNLLLNAMDAVAGEAPGNRRVAVASRRKASETLEIRVTDSGPGIDANEIARIFDPFHTTKSGGMGMGLAICRSIVEKHGGRLGVENAVGGGAQFSFTLPVQ